MTHQDTRPQPITAPHFPARHGFFTRRGGVSTGPFASLNCSVSSQDSPAAILENRARAAQALGVEPGRLLGLAQVHGVEAATAREAWGFGEGPAADACVTDRPGLGLAIITADCAPVLFSDPDAGIIGAAHAGWRGAVAGVIEATVAAMTGLGAQPGRITAAIGPCIGQSSYEIAADLRDAVLEHAADSARFFGPGAQPDRWQFDLGGYVASRLVAAGVGRVHRVDADTAVDEALFFSHRRRTLTGGGPIGHQISIIALLD